MNFNFLRTDLVAYNCTQTPNITTRNLNELGVGEIRLLNERGEIIRTFVEALEAKAVRIVQGRGNKGDYVISDIITAKDVISFTGQKFIQKRDRVVIIGFNGEDDGRLFNYGCTSRIVIEHDGSSEYKNANPYVAVSSNDTSPMTNQITIALSYLNIMANDYCQFKSRVMDVYALVNTEGANYDSIVFTNFKSSSIEVSSTGGLGVGDGIRFGLTKAHPVYVVKKIDKYLNLVYLDRPYTGESKRFLVSTTQIIDKDSLMNSDCGICIEGATPTVNPKFGSYELNDFKVHLSKFGETLVTVKEPIFPSGRHEQVLESILMNQHPNQMGLIQGSEFVNYREDVLENHGYSAVTIQWQTSEHHDGLNKSGQRKQLVIWIDRGSYVDIENDSSATLLLNNISTTGSVGDGVTQHGGSNSAGAYNLPNGFMNLLNSFMSKIDVVSKYCAESSVVINDVSNYGKMLACGYTDGTIEGTSTSYLAGVDF